MKKVMALMPCIEHPWAGWKKFWSRMDTDTQSNTIKKWEPWKYGYSMLSNKNGVRYGTENKTINSISHRLQQFVRRFFLHKYKREIMLLRKNIRIRLSTEMIVFWSDLQTEIIKHIVGPCWWIKHSKYAGPFGTGSIWIIK